MGSMKQIIVNDVKGQRSKEVDITAGGEVTVGGEITAGGEITTVWGSNSRREVVRM